MKTEKYTLWFLHGPFIYLLPAIAVTLFACGLNAAERGQKAERRSVVFSGMQVWAGEGERRRLELGSPAGGDSGETCPLPRLQPSINTA